MALLGVTPVSTDLCRDHVRLRPGLRYVSGDGRHGVHARLVSSTPTRSAARRRSMRVKPGTALRLWSDDAFGGALRSVDDLSSAKVDLRFVNPQTGPFYVEGAEPGDTLVLHLVALEPARDWGASAAIPFFGGMTEHRPRRHPAGSAAGHHLDLRARPRPQHRRVRGPAQRPPHRAARRADARHRRRRPGRAARCAPPWCPTASAATWTPRRCVPASTVFLGVNVEGAMFSIGDGHYRQGEGEACGTAVEGAMTTHARSSSSSRAAPRPGPGSRTTPTG